MNQDTIVEQLDSAQYLYLRELSEPHDNSLKLIVEQAVVNRSARTKTELPKLDRMLKDSALIESVEGCATFELYWRHYAAYLVTEELVGSNAKDGYDDEVYTGKLLRVYSASHFLRRNMYRFLVFSLLALSANLFAQSNHTLTLAATPKTVAWGYYDATATPVLHIQSGDTVTFETLLTNSPSGLEKSGLPPDQVQQNLRDIYKEITSHGPGGHILDGPVYIDGAEPGDTLEIRIQKIDLAIPYAYNGFRFGAGFLTQDFPYARTKIIPLNRERMVASFAPGIELPLHPFFGSMGVAPPEGYGRISSAPPGIHGGNMDNKELIAGTTLYLPVHTRGALFEIGDGHAGQGNGEVDITALETSLTGTLQFIVRKDLKVKYPRAETPTHYISMGFDDDLSEATRIAVRQMIDFLATERHLSRDDAYMLTSVAGDVDITELVDGNKGVHVMLPKSIFGTASR